MTKLEDLLGNDPPLRRANRGWLWASVTIVLLLAAWFLLALSFAGCGDRHRSVGLDLRGQVTSEVQAAAQVYRSAGLPLIPGQVHVRLQLRDPAQPSVVGQGSYTTLEQHGDGLWYLTVVLDQVDALAHELTHCFLWRVLGQDAPSAPQADGEHLSIYWAASRLLWPPGALRPAWVRALFGP